jgi:uncharacterized repeat protein (TIGR01451 family)
LGVASVSNQGHFTGSNFSPVSTDNHLAPHNPGDPTVTPATLSPHLAAGKTASLAVDADHDGLPSPGDTLLYTVQVRSDGDAGEPGVVFSDTPDAHTTLVVGSVTTSQGSVTQGNAPGDAAVTVNLGALASGSQANLTFRVVIRNPLPLGVAQVSNQGSATGQNVQTVTDDPGTPAPGDPTVTPITTTPNARATKAVRVAVDADHSNSASAGDTLEYTIVITNSGNIAEAGLSFSDTPDPNTLLLAGSVTTTQGSVTLGNTAGDHAVQVDLGMLAGGGGQATVTLRVRINSPLPAGVTHIRNQGLLTGDATETRTDDPSTSAGGDSTQVRVTAPTAVGLTSFRAVLLAGQKVQLSWTTATETDNYGFIIRRAPAGHPEQAVDVAFVPSKVPGGSGKGAAYTSLDAVPAKGQWIYWLVDVDTHGKQTPHTETVSADTSLNWQSFFIPMVTK